MSHTLVIAEIGINANGDSDLARDLIKGAKEAGVDLIKFQKRTINRVYTKEELDKPRDSKWGTTNRDQKIALEFTEIDYDKIDKYCKQLDIPWFASAWDLESVEFLKKYDCQYNKICSARLSHGALLQRIASQKKHTFIATGMATMDEIQKAVMVFRAYDCPFELMHCNSSYPAPAEDLNLKCMLTLQNYFKCDVGYSGHEAGLTPSLLAVAYGATSIERHITLDRTMYGSDQAASVEIQGFRRLVAMIREAEVALGDGVKRITPDEQKVRAKLWRDRDIVEK